jgi:hypothetical protein
MDRGIKVERTGPILGGLGPFGPVHLTLSRSLARSGAGFRCFSAASAPVTGGDVHGGLCLCFSAHRLPFCYSWFFVPAQLVAEVPLRCSVALGAKLGKASSPRQGRVSQKAAALVRAFSLGESLS